MALIKKMILNHFKSLYPKGILESPVDSETNKFKIILPDGTRWQFSIEVKYIGSEWFLSIFNNFINMEDQNAAAKWASLVKTGPFTSNKVNLHQTWKKYNTEEINEVVSNFQGEIINQILPYFWEDEGFIYFTYQNEQIFVGLFDDADIATEEMNQFFYTDMTQKWEDVVSLFSDSQIF